MNIESEVQVGAGIRRLRRQAGLLQSELATQLGIGAAALSSIENGRNQPTLRIIQRVIDIFGVTANDLFGSGPSLPAPAGRGGLDRVDDDASRITPSVAVIVDRLIDSVLALEDLAGTPKHSLLPLHIPLELSDDGLRALAERVRQYMRIYDGVVFDYFELFESYGLRVLVLPLRIHFFGAAFFDGKNENAFFIINNRHNAERQLYTLAMQLGRLFLHVWAARRGAYPDTRTPERLDPPHAAAKFAAHFLMPAAAIRATVAQLGIRPDQWTYELLLRIKHRFGVSAEAFLYRLDDLALIPRDVKKRLQTVIKKHYAETGNTEPDDSRRILTPNGRLWDLALTATLRHGEDHEELRHIKHDLRRMRLEKV